MPDLSPNQIVAAAYDECGAFGIGQTPRSTDLSAGLQRLGLMLTEWQQQKYLVYHQVGMLAQAKPGQVKYSVGPLGDFPIGLRPARIEAAFYRIYTQGAMGQGGIGQFVIGQSAIGLGGSPLGGLDYPIELLKASEDYQQIRMKGLSGMPSVGYYDPAWPLGQFFIWPLPNLQYQQCAIGLTFLETLPREFGQSPDTVFSLPDLYYNAMVLNLAVRLGNRLRLAPQPILVAQAKNSLGVLRGANAQVPLARMPIGLGRARSYNPYGDY